MSTILELKKQYSNWIMDSMKYSEVDSKTIRIDTPFMDNDFDDIILYVDLLKNNKLVISDDGYTLANLRSLGYSITNRSRKRINMVNDICEDYGVDFNPESNEIFIETNFNKFAVSKHRLLQAVLKINDMFLLRPNYEPNATFETVSKALDKHNILYSTKYPAIGKGGITFIFDFSIPTRQKHDKLIRIINSPNDLTYSKVLGMDVSMLKGTKDASFYAILDDISHTLTNYSEIVSIYGEVNDQYNVNISPIRVSELEDNIALLSN
ncbi:DUF1828 domain-containing protein [Alkalibacterium putridalgicola]|uniref:DUF1828 domain-containing protein n=1 Tax=Alkalibacterium putridalgicola TaxID=426703 RepID=UPI0034CEBF60